VTVPINSVEQPEPTTPYWVLPATGPYDVELGGALITMVEPHRGHERAYNRWYEDDHLYSGAMAMPWVFAGRRWVAPRRLQLLRGPDPSPVAQPVDAGCYIALYWITKGREHDHVYWAVPTHRRLTSDGRIFSARTHVFTAFQRHVGTLCRNGETRQDIHALDTNFGGLVVEVLLADGPAGTAALWDRLRTKHVPTMLEQSPVAMCVAFERLTMPPGLPAPYDSIGVPENYLTLLWFVDEDPALSWSITFAEEAERIARDDLGTFGLLAPFIPTVHGTDRYVDQLR
jgi:hypothetical protein